MGQSEGTKMSELYLVRMTAGQKERWQEVLKAVMQKNPDPRLQDLYNRIVEARQEKAETK
jgi:hypothetical protein